MERQRPTGSARLPIAIGIEPTLLGFVLELQGDHEGLQGPHECEAQDPRQAEPHHEVEPDRRRVGELDPEGKGHYKDADKGHDEEGRTITRVGEGEVKAADLAFRLNLEEALEYVSLAAAGA